ncbi:hypothetical protein JCM8547_004726 [Rhodosporidiobolus lusitaniae]
MAGKPPCWNDKKAPRRGGSDRGRGRGASSSTGGSRGGGTAQRGGHLSSGGTSSRRGGHSSAGGPPRKGPKDLSDVPRGTTAARVKPSTKLSVDEVIALAGGASSDGLASMSAGGDVDQEILRLVLSESPVPLSGTAAKYRFLTALVTSTRITATWTHEDIASTLSDLVRRDRQGLAVSPTSFRWTCRLETYLTSSTVKCCPVKEYNTAWNATTNQAVNDLMASKTVADTTSASSAFGFQPKDLIGVFGPLAQLLSRFSDAIVKSPELVILVSTVVNRFAEYAADGSAFKDAPTLKDEQSRRYVLREIAKQLSSLSKIIERVQAKPFSGSTPSKTLDAVASPAATAALRRFFSPPGKLRAEGRRHNNDFSAIDDIQIRPAQDELLCVVPDFVPANLPGARTTSRTASSSATTSSSAFFVTTSPVRSPRRSSPSFETSRTTPRRGTSRKLVQQGGGRYRPVAGKGDTTDLRNFDVGYSSIWLDKHELFGPQVAVKFFDGDAGQSAYLDAIDALCAERRVRQGGSENSDPEKLPATTPFASILAAPPPPKNQPIQLEPPLYARNPRFQFDLTCLLKPGDGGSLKLDVNDRESVVLARAALKSRSKLDPTQAGALVDCLTRELAIVEGPPGTGKSFLGVELLRVLIASKVGRICVLSHTNHALDVTLKNVKETGVTDKIVRCGLRSQDPEIQALSLFNLSKNAPRASKASRYELKEASTDRDEIEKAILTACRFASNREPRLSWRTLVGYLDRRFSEHRYAFRSLPKDVASAINELNEDGWTVAGRKHSLSRIPTSEGELFEVWRDSRDLDVLGQLHRERRSAAQALQVQQVLAQQHAQQARRSNPFEFPQDGAEPASASVSVESDYPLYTEPARNRDLNALLEESAVWSMSRQERQRLLSFYAEDVVRAGTERLSRLRARLDEVNRKIKEFHSISDRDILLGADIGGATMNGAANLLSLVESVRPSVLMVEEAGEALEAQVVANLYQSVQHLILTGDHLQLRVQIASYGLSIDSNSGKVYRHDVSLFERLATLPIPMSILSTQRSMRPEISKLVGNYLYPDLEGAPNTQLYPDVAGMSKNVFFIDHAFAEDPSSVSTLSRTSKEEARFVVDTVRHLLQQGQYKPGQIALTILKNALAAEKVTVVLDERDIAELEAVDEASESSSESDEQSARAQAQLRPLSDKSSFERSTTFKARKQKSFCSVSSATRAAVSTTRTSSPVMRPQLPSDFLKNPNQRGSLAGEARLYIFGAAAALRSKVPMWESVLGNLEADGSVGTKLPACCFQKGVDLSVDAPGELQKISPNGGCLKATATSSVLRSVPSVSAAGTSRTHPRYDFPIERLTLPCGHVVENISCFDAVDPHSVRCQVKIPSTVLDCGHTARNVPCWKVHKGGIVCVAQVSKELPCGHSTTLECPTDPTSYRSEAVCGAVLNCSHGSCAGRCIDCKSLQKSEPNAHIPHAHGSTRLCGHRRMLRARQGWSLPVDLFRIVLKELRPHDLHERLHPTSMLDALPGLSRRLHDPELSASVLGALQNSPGQHSVRQAAQRLRLPLRRPSERAVPAMPVARQEQGASHVETLDGTVELDKFYFKDENNRWYGTLQPGTDSTTPSCATCKTPVSSTSTASLFQERTRSLAGQDLLNGLASKFNAFDTSTGKARADKPLVVLSESKVSLHDREAARRRWLQGPGALIVTLAFIDKTVLGLPNKIREVYLDSTRQIIGLLREACDLALHRSPQTKIYDAAVSTLFHQEKQRIMDSNERVRNVDALAVQIARSRCGMTALSAASRVTFEAIQIIFALRYSLLDAVQRLASMVKNGKSQNSKDHELRLRSFGKFILESVQRDINVAIESADEKNSWRSSHTGRLALLRNDLEMSRFDVRIALDEKTLTREQAALQVEQQCKDGLSGFKTAVAEFLEVMAASTAWVEQDIKPGFSIVQDEWESLLKSVKAEYFYQEVTNDEGHLVIKAFRRDCLCHGIVAPMDTRTRSAIVEEQMQQASCPECGATIGGGSQRLADDNTNDIELDRLAMEGGARREYLWGVRA